MLALTESAVEAVRRVVAGADDVSGLRIMVESGGCSGWRYRLGLESEAYDGDRVYEFGDVKVYVDADSQPMLDGVQVDFVEDLAGSGFVFNNPNAAASCSCGKSFSC